MSSSDMRGEVVTDSARGAFAWRGRVLAFLRRLDTPLALPTLSLLFALSGNPALRAINAPLMLWNAYPIAKRAWRVWRDEGRLNVDFLDALAVVISVFQGDAFAGAFVTWLIKLGDWIRDLTAAGSRRALNELVAFQAKRAWVRRDGDIVAVPPDELVVGEEVVVHVGEVVPVDGEIVDGKAMVDQKTITGESLPVARSAGEFVYAACVLREGQLTIKARRVGEATNAAQIAALVAQAPIGDTRMQNHAEQLADRLVIPTLALAIGAAFLWRDFTFVLSLLIVDFGTGVRVAAPTAMLSSMIKAARSGVLFKSGAPMERLAAVDTIIFDKTGTLTRGAPEIGAIVCYAPGVSDTMLIGLAAAVEARLQHPVATALRAKAEALGADIPICSERKYEVGLGVEGWVKGRHVLVGAKRFMVLRGVEVGDARESAALEAQGFSCLYVALDGRLAGLATYRDEIRPEAEAAFEELRAAGIKHTVLLTGDNFAVARAVGQRLGITRVFAEMSPADKAEAVKSFQRNGHVVAMIGDGVNDSPALSFADVGVSVKHGTEIARESAGVVLMEDSLKQLPKAVEMARRSVKLIKDNCLIVVGMNAQALALVLIGAIVNPGVTALISNGSAIIASLNGLSPILPRLMPRSASEHKSKRGDSLGDRKNQ